MNKDPIETANEFCESNNIKKDTREKILQKIKELQKIYKRLDAKENKK